MVDRSVSIALQAQVSGFVAGIRTAQAAASGFMAELDKSAKKRAALNDLGMAAGKVGLAAAAGLGLAVAAAANFDQAMSRVQGATQDSAKQMELLRTAAINAGRDTVFSASEAAAAEEEMAKAGVKTKDILSGGLTGALNLASAGTISVADAAQIAATTMNQFGLAGTQVTHIADVLAATAGKAQGDVTDMAEALKYVGPVASQMGVSLEQTAGSIGYLASQGILGSQAGTSLRGILTALTSPSKQAAKVMDDLGISMYDAQGKFVGLDGIAGQLHQTMSGLTNAQRDQALGQMFGNQQITAARILYAGGAQAVDNWSKKVNDSGYAAKLAATKMNNLKGDLEQLKGSLETALIGTGEGAQTPLRSLVQHITSVVNAYSNLGAGAKQGVAEALGATALLGGGVFVMTKLILGVSAARTAIKELGVTAEGAGVAMKGMVAAGVIVGLDLLANKFLAAKNDAHNLNQEIQLLALGQNGPMNFDFGFKDLGHVLKEASQETKLFGDAVKSFPDFMQTSGDVAQLDASLAKLARTNPKAASSAFAQIKTEAAAAGVSMKDLMALFPQFEAVIGAPKKAKANLIDLGGLLNGLNHLRDYRSELMKLPRQVLTQVVSPTALKTTKQVEALAKQYKLTPKQVETIMRARNFASPEIQKVLKALHLVDQQHPTPKIGADNSEATNRYHVTKSQLIELGNAHSKSTIDANNAPALSRVQVAMHTLGIYGNQHPSATLDANANPAMSKIQAVRNALNTVTGSFFSTIFTTHVDKTVKKATGGFITGTGTGTSDSIPALLSNGEFVVNAAATKRNLSLLHSINAQRFAAGGQAGGSSNSGGSSISGSSTHLTPAQKEIRKARAEAAKRHAEHMAALHKQLDLTQKQLQTAVQFNQSVQQNFRVDPFQNNATLQGVMASIASDTGRAKDFSAAARNAKRLGLDGGVFRALLASGDTSVLQDITTRGQVKALEAAWRARNKATADLTFGAGTSGKYVGDSIRELKQTIDRLDRQLHHMRKDVHDGAKSGTRAGTKDNRGHRSRAASRANLP